MAEQRRFLDVWIVETNTVYREVPFAVVTDWVQQGRLLEDDRLRPSGTGEWHRLGNMPDFRPYLPHEEPARPQDQAEALEPVHLDVGRPRRHEEEDDDPDMIPLIDVSLVLLIFFMMTMAMSEEKRRGKADQAAAPAELPAAYYALITLKPDMIWIGVDCDDSRQPTVYTIGAGDRPADIAYQIPPDERPPPSDREMKVAPGFEKKLTELLRDLPKPVDVVIKTHKDLKQGYYLNLLLELQDRKHQGKVKAVYDGVREKPAP